MDSQQFARRVGAIASVFAAMILGAQIVLGIRIGSELAAMQSPAPVAFINLVAGHAPEIKTLMALDDFFVVAYLMAFVGLASAVWERHALALIGLGSGIVLAFFDFLENSMALGLVGIYLAEQTRNALPSIESNHLLALNVIGQMKWVAASVAAASFGIAVWDARGLNRVVSILFLLFAPLVAWGMASGAGGTARILWMLVVFVAGAVFLSRREVALSEKM